MHVGSCYASVLRVDTVNNFLNSIASCICTGLNGSYPDTEDLSHAKSLLTVLFSTHISPSLLYQCRCIRWLCIFPDIHAHLNTQEHVRVSTSHSIPPRPGDCCFEFRVCSYFSMVVKFANGNWFWCNMTDLSLWTIITCALRPRTGFLLYDV